MNKYLIPNLSNACQVIKDLLLHGEQGRSFVNLQQDLDIPKSTLFRILKTLEHENMVQKREGLLYPGPVLQGSASGGGNERLRKLAVPVLQELADRTGETAHLAVLKGFQALILEVCDGPNPVHVASRPGTLASLVNSATGKVLLTFHFGEHVQDVLDHISFEARTPHSITDLDGLRREIDFVQRLGYAVDNEEYHPGVRCLAVPVFDVHGNVIAALGITAPALSFKPGMEREIYDDVRRAADRLQSKLND